MINALLAGLMALAECVWHLAQLGLLILCIGCLVAPITYGIYHHDKCKEEKNGYQL